MNILTIIFWKNFEKETVLTAYAEDDFFQNFFDCDSIENQSDRLFFCFHEGTKRKNHSSKDWKIR